jgi:hypothetical protein
MVPRANENENRVLPVLLRSSIQGYCILKAKPLRELLKIQILDVAFVSRHAGLQSMGV